MFWFRTFPIITKWNLLCLWHQHLGPTPSALWHTIDSTLWIHHKVFVFWFFFLNRVIKPLQQKTHLYFLSALIFSFSFVLTSGENAHKAFKWTFAKAREWVPLRSISYSGQYQLFLARSVAWGQSVVEGRRTWRDLKENKTTTNVLTLSQKADQLIVFHFPLLLKLSPFW